MSTEALVLGSIQTATFIVMFLYVLYTRSLAKETRILAKATQEAYLNPQVLLQVEPYGRTGALNLVLENIGRGVAKEIQISFPNGLFAVVKTAAGTAQSIDLTQYHIFSEKLLILAPGERHEMFLGCLDDFKKLNIPTKFPYKIHYLTSADQPKSISGALDLQVYDRNLVAVYTNIEDLRRELEEIRKVISAKLG